MITKPEAEINILGKFTTKTEVSRPGAQYIKENSKVLAPLDCFAELVFGPLWADHHALFT